MIDLHCHLLPGIDDGPADVEGSLALARAQVDAGVRTVAVTPHVSRRIPNDAKRISRGVRELRSALKRAGIPLAIRRGAEVDLLKALELSDEELRRLALGDGKGWLLLEAPLTSTAPLEAGVAELQGRGLQVLLAHPERSPMLQRNPEVVRRLVRGGVRTQLTAGGLNGQFGRVAQQLAGWLADEGLIHTFASDAHDPSRRPPGLRGPLERAGLGAHVELLCERHPAALLAGAELPEHVALPRRRRGLFSALARARG